MKPYYRALFFLSVLLIAACSSQSAKRSSTTQPGYKVGEPYQVSGSWYYPKEDYSYDETGIASWYGQGFHGQTTANGEIFNKNELTAAHKTLPLPTLARVTNLDNGRSIVVRINDRGPFSGTRLIDLSQRAAQLLGFEQQGTAKVRVQVLADESKAIADAMRHYGKSGAPLQVASMESPSANTMSEGAPLLPVTSQTLDPPSPESAQLEPIKTTPQIHQRLLETKPVAQVLQVPVTGTGQIYVQAGSFTVAENATKLQQTLSSIGPTKISEIVINGKKFYRVRIGPIADVSRADTALAHVKKTGASGARIIIN